MPDSQFRRVSGYVRNTGGSIRSSEIDPAPPHGNGKGWADHAKSPIDKAGQAGTDHRDNVPDNAFARRAPTYDAKHLGVRLCETQSDKCPSDSLRRR